MAKQAAKYQVNRHNRPATGRRNHAVAKSGGSRSRGQPHFVKALHWNAYKGASVRGEITVTKLRAGLGVSQEELARVTGYSTRSIAGWEAGKNVSESAKQKLAETDRLRAALEEIVGNAQIGNWMRTPNAAFEGQTPIQVIERGESDRLWKMIFQINSGVAS